jgi:hypothetical protein
MLISLQGAPRFLQEGCFTGQNVVHGGKGESAGA